VFRQLSEAFDAHRALVAAFVAAATAVASYGVYRLEYDDVPRATFRSDDTDFVRLEEAFRDFGADDLDCVFLVESERIAYPNNLAPLRRFCAEMVGIG